MSSNSRQSNSGTAFRDLDHWSVRHFSFHLRLSLPVHQNWNLNPDSNKLFVVCSPVLASLLVIVGAFCWYIFLGTYVLYRETCCSGWFLPPSKSTQAWRTQPSSEEHAPCLRHKDAATHAWSLNQPVQCPLMTRDGGEGDLIGRQVSVAHFLREAPCQDSGSDVELRSLGKEKLRNIYFASICSFLHLPALEPFALKAIKLMHPIFRFVMLC